MSYLAAFVTWFFTNFKFNGLFFLLAGGAWCATWLLDGIVGAIVNRETRERYNWMGNSSNEPFAFIVAVLSVTGAGLGILSFIEKTKGNPTPLVQWLTGFLAYSLVFGSLEASPYIKRFGAWCIRSAHRGWKYLAENWQKRKVRVAQVEEQKRELTGENILEDFKILQSQLEKMIGDSPILSTLKIKITQIVTSDLISYLKLRQYLIENLPNVRQVVEKVGDGGGIEITMAERSREILKRLETRLAEVENTIRRMQVSLEHMRPIIVEARAGLSSQQDLAENALRELDEYAVIIQDSVRASVAVETLEENTQLHLVSDSTNDESLETNVNPQNTSIKVPQ